MQAAVWKSLHKFSPYYEADDLNSCSIMFCFFIFKHNIVHIVVVVAPGSFHFGSRVTTSTRSGVFKFNPRVASMEQPKQHKIADEV